MRIAPAARPLAFGTTPPTGWTRVNVTGERLVKLAGSSDTIGATGGSWTISGQRVEAERAAAEAEPAPELEAAP